MNREKDKMEIKFEKPPVHITASGSLYINADDIFHSKAGQEIILRMAQIAPFPHPREKTNSEK